MSAPVRGPVPASVRGALIALLVLILDQASKYWILNVYDLPAKRVVEITSFFNLAMVWNPGVSFGLFQADSFWGKAILVIFTLGVVTGLAIWYLRGVQGWAMNLSLPLVIGGAIGNLVDRIRFGAVADFLDFHAFGWHFWTFNVADSAIVCGIGLLLLDGLFLAPETAKQNK